MFRKILPQDKSYIKLIDIPPDSQTAPVVVQMIDHPVVVGIFLGQGLEGVAAGAAAVIAQSAVPEQFPPVVDDAVVVAVKNQQAVAVMIEHDPGPKTRRLQAVAVQVQSQRVSVSVGS